MNKQFLETLLRWPKSYISGIDLYALLDKSDHSRHAIIKRAVQMGYLISLKRDLYLIQKEGQSALDAFEIASILYGPSYISFESALSYHGWIPEAVNTTTSASSKRSKLFDTPIGVFSYEHIPIKAFSLGVEQHIQTNQVNLFIASPLKALADLIYARKRSWNHLEDLSADLRIDPELFQTIDSELFSELIHNYPSQRVSSTLKRIKP